MTQLLTFKIIAVLVVCFSAALFANTNINNEPVIPQTTTPTKQAPENIPSVLTGSRGQLLYENHCTVCHDSRVHIREKRKSRSVTDIEKWVIHWSQHLKLDWDRAEINQISEYLNLRFYQFPDANIDNR
ncbi:MAG: hypothetical protein QNK15_06080 [Cycloclasticus sp.]|nr:hypothetical protein [Cycloclasticus sp.]